MFPALPAGDTGGGAGPVGELIGIPVAFLVAGIVPVALAALTLVIARLGADELALPLDPEPPAEDDASTAVTGPGVSAGLQPPVDEPREPDTVG